MTSTALRLLSFVAFAEDGTTFCTAFYTAFCEHKGSKQSMFRRWIVNASKSSASYLGIFSYPYVERMADIDITGVHAVDTMKFIHWRLVDTENTKPTRSTRTLRMY